MVILSNVFESLNEMSNLFESLSKKTQRKKLPHEGKLDRPKTIKEMELAPYAKTNPRRIKDSNVKHNFNKTISKKYISKYFLDFVVKDFLHRTQKKQ